MLRYFAYSIRNFQAVPDLSDHRLNWEIWVTFAGRVRPRFRSASHWEIPEANFWVMPPGARYRWEAQDAEVERAVFHFAYIPHQFEEIVQSRGYFARRLTPDELAEARQVALTVATAQQRRGRCSTLWFQRAALDLALLALRGEPDATVSALDMSVAERVEKAVAWYKAHVREAPKFSRLAGEMHVSVSQLRRLFQVHYGMSPKLVLDKLRLDCAVDLLTATRGTLEETAQQSGFRSSTDFCRVFRKHYGYSPHVWRRTVGVFDRALLPRDSKLREIDVQRLVATSPAEAIRPSAGRAAAMTVPARGAGFALGFRV